MVGGPLVGAAGVRIVHVIPSLAAGDGGPPWMARALATAQHAAGAEVTVCTLDDGRDELTIPQGIRVHRMTPPGGAVLRVRAIRQWLAQIVPGCDALHLHSVYTATTWAALNVAKHLGVSPLISPHGALMRSGAVRPWELWKPAWLWAAVASLGRRNLRFHFFSGLEEERSRWTGLAAVTYAPLWPFRNHPKLCECDRAGFVFVGRLHPVKRVEIALRALAEVPGARLTIVGTGSEPYEATLRKLAARLAVTRRIRWAGYLGGEDKRDVIRHAAALLLPSRFESFGVVALEAASEGVPSIISRSTGVRDILEDAGAALVVEGGVTSWARAMRRLAENPDERRALAQNAARWAASLPDLATSGALSLQLY